MAKTRRVDDGASGSWMFFCPACGCAHVIRTPVWSFDGNVDAPTFAPSIKVTGKRMVTDAEVERIMAGEKVDIPDECCHSFVRDGKIQYLADCTHAMAGQTVELPDV